jgi:hypothetical protein
MILDSCFVILLTNEGTPHQSVACREVYPSNLLNTPPPLDQPEQSLNCVPQFAHNPCKDIY